MNNACQVAPVFGEKKTLALVSCHMVRLLAEYKRTRASK